jgi:hypothetical protein
MEGCLLGIYVLVGAPGFEPGTSRTRTVRSSRAEPRPVDSRAAGL